MQKKTIVIISVSIIFGVLVVILANLLFLSLIGKVFKPEDVPKEEIITEFKTNKKSFVTISDYLTQDEKDICFIILNNNEFTDLFTDENRSQTLKISDVLINDAFDKIMKKMNFKYIYEKENTIYFFREMGRGYHKGILYQKNGIRPDSPEIEVLEKIDDNWFYYIAN